VAHYSGLRKRYITKYTIFGQLTGGEEVLDAIATAPRGPQDRPVNPVSITRVTIEEA